MADISDIANRLNALTVGTRFKEDSLRFLNEKGIDLGSTVLPSIDPGHRDDGGTTLVRTNMFPAMLRFNGDIFQYSISIRGLRSNSENRVEVDFTQRGISEVHDVDRRMACHRIFRAVVSLNSNVFGDHHCCYYDLRRLFFSILNYGPYGAFYVRLEQIEEEINVGVEAAYMGCDEFKVEFSKVEGVLKTDLKHLAISQDSDDQNQALLQFIEIASSQSAFDNDEVLNFPTGVSYPMVPESFSLNFDEQPLGKGTYLSLGMEKSARFVRDENGNLNAGIFITPKITPFHSMMTVAEKYVEFRDHYYAESILKGMYIYPIHLTERAVNRRLFILKIVRLGHVPQEEFFQQDGRTISVAEHFLQSYGHKCKPTLPVVVAKLMGKDVCFPMELCQITDNQRVKLSAMSPEMVGTIIKTSAVPPIVVQKRVEGGSRVYQLRDSQYMNEVQIEIPDQPLDIVARFIPPPLIQYASYRSQYDRCRNNWMTNKFAIPAKPPFIWALYICVRDGSPVWDEEKINNFVTAYTRSCRFKGLLISTPTEKRIIYNGSPVCPEAAELRKRMEIASRNRCEFVMIISNKDDAQMHSNLKAFELEFDVITQNVTSRIAFDAAGINVPRPKSLTMENIVNKTNIKLGGVNYKVNSVGQHELLIGLATNTVAASSNHYSDAGPPTFAANDSKCYAALTGDFCYQYTPRDGDLEAVEHAVSVIVKKYKDNHDLPPRKVVIYQSGCSDGQFANLMRYELPVVRYCIRNCWPKDTPPLLFIVVNNVHNIRLTPVNPNGRTTREQNLPSGIVVDRGIVHPSYPEFYLVSHCPHQGTTKVPRYTILCNEPNMDMDDIQEITHSLCFCHQIINSPISMPSPIYSAREYAKRGRNLYNSGSLDQRKIIISNDETRLKGLNQYLSYNELKRIRNVRVNA